MCAWFFEKPPHNSRFKTVDKLRDTPTRNLRGRARLTFITIKRAVVRPRHPTNATISTSWNRRYGRTSQHAKKWLSRAPSRNVFSCIFSAFPSFLVLFTVLSPWWIMGLTWYRTRACKTVSTVFLEKPIGVRSRL